MSGSTDLSAPWESLLTTNVLRMPFEYVDYDVNVSAKPHKFYRVRQSDEAFGTSDRRD